MKLKNILPTLLLTCLIITFCKTTVETETKTESASKKNVQTILNEVKKDFNYGGVVAALIKSDGTIDSGAFGLSDSTTPLTTSMSLGIGSNTKTFTAALALKLVEKRKLKLDQTLQDLVPEIVSKNIKGDITVKQLLTHSSGLYDPLNENDDLINSIFENPTHAFTNEELFSKILAPYFENGTSHKYSNTNYTILGLIIEKVSGKKFHTYLREVIFTPLNLKNSFLSVKEQPTNTVGFSWGPTGESLKDFPREGIESLAWSAGSIFSSVKDLGSWYHALFDGKIINSKSLESMLPTTAEKSDLNYGMGIFSKNYKGDEVYFHSGQTIAYTSFFIYDKKTKDVIIVIVNQIENNPELLAYKILDELTKKSD